MGHEFGDKEPAVDPEMLAYFRKERPIRVATVPAFMKWDLEKIAGSAAVDDRGSIIIRIQPSDKTKGLFGLAQDGFLIAFSVDYSYLAAERKDESGTPNQGD